MTINQITGTECGTEIAKIINRLISEKSDTDLGNLSAIGQAILDGKSSISLDNLSAAGQAILDKKVEVEALLQQNGYAKFTWKENNQISNLIIQWGVDLFPIMYADGSTNTINFPRTFNQLYSVNTFPVVGEGGVSATMNVLYLPGLSNSQFEYFCFCRDAGISISKSVYWIAIGK